MPAKKAAPQPPKLPPLATSTQPDNAVKTADGTFETAAYSEKAPVVLSGMADGSPSDRSSSVTAMRQGLVPLTAAARAGASPAAGESSASPASAAASLSPANKPVAEPAQGQHSNFESAIHHMQSAEADQQSAVASAAGGTTTTEQPKSSPAEFSFKRAPRKSTKSSAAADPDGLAAATTALSSAAGQKTLSADPAAAKETADAPTQIASQATQPMPSLQEGPETNGPQTIEDGVQQENVTQANAAASRGQQQQSGSPAGVQEHQFPAPMEGVEEQPSTPPAAPQEQQSSVAMEGIEQPPTTSANDEVLPSDSSALTTQPASSPLEPLADVEATVSTNLTSAPDESSRPASGPATPQSHPQTGAPPSPESERTSVPIMSALPSKDNSVSEDTAMHEVPPPPWPHTHSLTTTHAHPHTHTPGSLFASNLTLACAVDYDHNQGQNSATMLLSHVHHKLRLLCL